MVFEKRRSLGEFHARLRQLEAGLFRAESSGEINPENPDRRAIPDYHLGTSLTNVKTWVEQMALGLGYERIVWISCRRHQRLGPPAQVLMTPRRKSLLALSESRVILPAA